MQPDIEINYGTGASYSNETMYETTVETGTAVYDDSKTTSTASEAVEYILNANTKKFHYVDCSSVDAMKESNKIYFSGTREDAINHGFDPCGRCHP